MSDKLTDSDLSGFVRKIEDLMAGWTCVKGKLKPLGSRVKEVETYKYTDATGRRVEFEVYMENTFHLCNSVIGPFLNFSLHRDDGGSGSIPVSTVKALHDVYKEIRAFRR